MRRLQLLTRVLLLALLLASTTTAQDQRIVSRTNFVSVNVIVTDKSGRYVRGLTSDDFELFDEKVKQQIAHFSSDPAPVSLGIVYEIHPRPFDRRSALLAALRQFTRNLGDGDDFFFLGFGAQGSVTTGFVPTEEQVLNHLAAIRPGGASSLHDAIYTAADRLRKQRNLKKALLIISDGSDDQSTTSYKALRNRLREFDVQIYAVAMDNAAMDRTAGYGRWIFEDITRQTKGRAFQANAETSVGHAVLSEMARISGGTAYYPETENEPELVGICTQLATELRQQYTIGFYPAGVESNRTWHRIKITLKPGSGRRGLSLAYRQGYRRSEPPVVAGG
ncbi:MAG TPA: VWA domain-containing protein [Pyrinomonadaceae bacterium]|nr:VWA domain-containing protein [Pyrinomonadaceae bacterium]